MNILQRGGARKALMALVFWLTAWPAHAVLITYDLLDIQDTLSGDRWQYTFQLSDYTFLDGDGFTIYFGYGSYADLSASTASADWDVISADPNATLTADGFVDGMALTDSADLSQPFIVEVTWLGSPGTPGPLFYEVYDLGGVVATGSTQGANASVPLPPVLALFGVGLFWRRRPRSARAGLRGGETPD